MSWSQMWMKGQRECFLRLRSPDHISMTTRLSMQEEGIVFSTYFQERKN